MIRKLLPFIVLAAMLSAAWFVTQNPPQARRSAPREAPAIAVDTLKVYPQSYQVLLSSYGTVRPRTQGQLLPQVSGKIINISDNFRNGGFFEKGELLVQLDDRDYKAAVRTAEATLIEAEQALVQEHAQAKQAKADWKRLGNKGKAPALVQRQPQLKAAQAKVLSAKASLSRAQLDLERSRITAPYPGRILTANVDIGQVVTSTTALADIYAIDYVEIRLPLKNRDLAYVDLPENYRFSQAEQAFPDVIIESDLITPQQWYGSIVRTEGAIDDSSQQLYVTAQIDDPYGSGAENRHPLKIGQYVTAEIKGRLLSNAIVIPNTAIYQGSYVYLVKDSLLQRQPIDIAWQNDQIAVISEGIFADDELVTTPLGQVSSGSRVKISNGKAEPTKQANANQDGALN